MAPLHYLLVSASILGGRGASAAPSPHVTDIHVVFSNHLDVGFNERSWNMSPSERCEGLFSPDGERCMPLAANVTSEYFNVYFPRAAAMADAARAKGGDRYIYMAQPWVIALFLDCAGSGVNDWRPGHTSDALLTCPNASTVTQFKRAVRQGDIFFQAFPHSSCPESYDASQFEASLGIGARLADQLGVPRPKTFSQRDGAGSNIRLHIHVFHRLSLACLLSTNSGVLAATPPETGMSRAILAVGETVILLHPPSPFTRCFNRCTKGVSSK